MRDTEKENGGIAGDDAIARQGRERQRMGVPGGDVRFCGFRNGGEKVRREKGDGQCGTGRKSKRISYGKGEEKIMAKPMKCAERVARQKEMIEKTLVKEPMTIAGLASTLSLSVDTIRNRLNEMRVERRPIRVVDWEVLETAMVRVWGCSYGRDEPRPVRVRVEGVKRASGRERVRLPGVVLPVRFRREGMDEWLFRIRELR